MQRSLSSALKKKPPGVTRVVCKPTSLRSAYGSIRSAQRSGYRVRPTQPMRKISARQAARLQEDQPGALQALQVRQHPACRVPLAQQRPHRDHARPVHGGALPREAEERPEVRQPARDLGERRGRGQLSLPGQVPQRPEPDLHRGTHPHRQGGSQSSAPEPARHPRCRRLQALQRADRGVGREGRRRAHRRRQGPAARQPAQAGRADEGRDHPGRPGGRHRDPQPHHRALPRARHLRARDRRLRARQLQGLLPRRVRHAHLHVGPRAHERLRGDGPRGLRRSIRAPP